jgi:hypothetical protein
MAISLKHASLTQLGTAFRERLRDAKGLEAGRLAKWFISRLADGTFTDLQARTLFGLNVTQYNQLKTRLQTMADRYDVVLAQVGE